MVRGSVLLAPLLAVACSFSWNGAGGAGGAGGSDCPSGPPVAVCGSWACVGEVWELTPAGDGTNCSLRDAKGVCLAGQCVACIDDQQCSDTGSVTEKVHCELGSHTCVQCTEPKHCQPSAPFCQEATHACVACLVDGDCTTASTPWCEPQQGACVKCFTNDHCPAPETCCQPGDSTGCATYTCKS